MVRSCSSIKSKAMQSSLHGENIKRKNEPIYDKIIYFSLFESCLRNGIIFFWGGDRESSRIFKLQKQVLQVNYGVSSHTSRRQIFTDYNVLTLPSLYILEVICFIKKQNVFMVKKF
jgi:hypothetical protein